MWESEGKARPGLASKCEFAYGAQYKKGLEKMLQDWVSFKRHIPETENRRVNS